MQAIHRMTPATLNIHISTYEKSRPYSWTSGCACISERIVKHTWKHHVNPTAKSQAHGHGSGETKHCARSAAATTIIVQKGKKYGASVIQTLDFERETTPPATHLP